MRLLRALLLVAALQLLSQVAYSTPSCENIFAINTQLGRDELLHVAATEITHSPEFQSIKIAISMLPKQDSLEWQSMVAEIRHGLEPTNGVGFAAINLRPYLPLESFAALFHKMSFAGTILAISMSAEGVGARGNFRHFDASRASDLRSLDEIALQFRILGLWVDLLVSEALPEYPAKISYINDVRIINGDGGTSAPTFHDDGNFLTGTLTVDGDHGTQIREFRNDRFFEAASGFLVLISGMARAKAHAEVRVTRHRSPPPGENPNRAVFLWRTH